MSYRGPEVGGVVTSYDVLCVYVEPTSEVLKR